MARWMEPEPEQIDGYHAWVASRPDVVRVVAERFEPWSVYRLKTTGSVVTIAAFNEDGTVRVDISAEFNDMLFMERSVFGINPDDLEPCELPAIIGLHPLLSHEDVHDNLDAFRLNVRPDVWMQCADCRSVVQRGTDHVCAATEEGT